EPPAVDTHDGLVAAVVSVPGSGSGRTAATPGTPDAAGAVIACDESGYESDMLVGTPTDVLAHAGVQLDAGGAGALMARLREQIGSPARHYEASHVVRPRSRPVLVWLLSPSGPLSGNAHAYLVNKVFFLLHRLLTLLAAPPAPGQPAPAADPPG